MLKRGIVVLQFSFFCQLISASFGNFPKFHKTILKTVILNIIISSAVFTHDFPDFQQAWRYLEPYTTDYNPHVRGPQAPRQTFHRGTLFSSKWKHLLEARNGAFTLVICLSGPFYLNNNINNTKLTFYTSRCMCCWPIF